MSFLWPKKKDQCDAGFNFNPHVHGIIFAWTNFHVFFYSFSYGMPHGFVLGMGYEWNPFGAG